MTISTTAVAELESLISDGFFAFRTDTSVSTEVYPHHKVYGSCVESVARGLLALGKTKADSLVDITACKVGSQVPSIFSRYGPRRKFVVFNLQSPCYRCGYSSRDMPFDLYAPLGLRAVTLEIGFTHEGPLAQVGLILPRWGTGQHPARKGEVTFLTFDVTGRESGVYHRPFVFEGGDSKNFTDEGGYVQHALGITPLKNIAVMAASNGRLDATIGFPGAEDFLVARLPGLGDHFATLASLLAADHTRC